MSPPRPYRSVSAYLASPDAEAIWSFAEAVFDAKVVNGPLRAASGRLVHVALGIGDSVVLLGVPKDGVGLPPGMLHVYVDECAAAHSRALAAGATEMMAPQEQFYGDRAAMVSGPGGTIWWIAERLRDVSSTEMVRLAAEHVAD